VPGNTYLRRQFLKFMLGAGLAAPAFYWTKNDEHLWKYLLTSNISMGPGNYFPTFSPPQSLDVATIIGLPQDQQLLFVSLQGLVNRVSPKIYLLQDDEEGRLSWLQEFGIPYKFYSSPWELFSYYKCFAFGTVVYDDALLDTINLATTISGLRSLLISSPQLADTLTFEFGYEPEVSLIDKFSSKIEAYTFAMNNLWNQCPFDILFSISPSYPASNPPVILDPFYGEITPPSVGPEPNEGNLPNAFLRDYAVALSAKCFFLDSSINEEANLLTEILEKSLPGSPLLGWFPNASFGNEYKSVSMCSISSHPVFASDFCTNLSVFSGIQAPIVAQTNSMAPQVSNLYYVTFSFSDGDNLQYDEHHMRLLWDDPNRGKVPLNWTIDPGLLQIAPFIISYYLSSKSTNDLLIAGPSGAGYIYPSLYPLADLVNYLNAASSLMNSAGLKIVNVLNHPEGFFISPGSQVESLYDSLLSPIGVFSDWSDVQSQSVWGTSTPAAVGQLATTAQDISTFLAGTLNQPNQPTFLSIGLSAFNLSPTDVYNVVSNITSPYVSIVTADIWFNLLRQHLGLSQKT
jgi:hypothetical protein